jgi:hypothetical protein
MKSGATDDRVRVVMLCAHEPTLDPTAFAWNAETSARRGTEGFAEYRQAVEASRFLARATDTNEGRDA